MASDYEKMLKKLEQTEAQLEKAMLKKKNLEAEKKALLVKAETERLSSRGRILESFLKEPLVLKNKDITKLLGLMFRSSFSQETLDNLILSRKNDVNKIVREGPGELE